MTYEDRGETQEPPQSVTTPALEVRGLNSGYGDLQALRDVDLVAHHGAVELVIGPNGAGKTTLLGAIAGLLPTWRGSILVDGEDISDVPAYRRSSRKGVSLVMAERRLFRRRTVYENLVIGCHGHHLNNREVRDRVSETLDYLPLLKDMVSRRAGSLSGGQQQILAIGQSLVAHPKVLLLDEPSAGLAPPAVDSVVEILARLRDRGTCVVLVEQIVDRVMPIADHVTVMNGGQVAMHGDSALFTDEDVLRRAYFGAS